MRLNDLVDTADAVAGTSARNAKTDALASLLLRLSPDRVEPVVCMFSGEPRQGRIGVGWRTLEAARVPPASPRRR